MRRPLAVAMAVLAVAAGCGGGSGEEAKEPATTTTATTASGIDPAVAPLTGLAGDPEALRRPALVVKVDNAPKARPQAGLNQADIVVEEGVEGGVTRFAAVFQSTGAEVVGPVRSARSTDIAIAGALGRPLFGYSGANATFAKLLAESSLVDVGVGVVGGAYRRDPDRPRPYNLFTATAPLFGHATDQGAPPPLFSYRGAGEAPPEAGSEAAPRVEGVWKDRIVTTVAYSWDPKANDGAGGFARTQDGAAHLDAAGAAIAPENVVFQVVRYRDTGLVDQSGAAVPEAELVGGGEAMVLTAGRLVRGRWSKDGADGTTRITDAAGGVVLLTPGRTWVELVPEGNLSTG